jgi:hypothetical protein
VIVSRDGTPIQVKEIFYYLMIYNLGITECLMVSLAKDPSPLTGRPKGAFTDATVYVMTPAPPRFDLPSREPLQGQSPS